MAKRDRLPDELLSRAFSTRRALELGVTPDRLRSSDLVAPYPGVRVAGPTPDSAAKLVAAYQPRLRATDVVSHVSAAHLWGMPLPQRLSLPISIDISATAPGRAPEARGVRGRQLALADDEVRQIGGIGVTSPALTWCLLGSILSIEDLIAVADYIVTPTRTRTALATLAELEECTLGRAGMRGVVATQRALPWVRVGPLSRPETLLRVVLVWAGIPEPAINTRILDSEGRFLAMPDIAWPDYRLASEYEGDYHRVERGQFHHDIGRIERMADEGWGVVRVSAPALFDETSVLVARIARRLTERGWSPPRPLDMRKVGRLRR